MSFQVQGKNTVLTQVSAKMKADKITYKLTDNKKVVRLVTERENTVKEGH